MASAEEAVAGWILLATEDKGLRKSQESAMHGTVITESVSEKILDDWRRMSGVGCDLLTCLNSNFYCLKGYDRGDGINWCLPVTAEGGACAAMQLSRSQSMTVVWGVSMAIGQ